VGFLDKNVLPYFGAKSFVIDRHAEAAVV